MPSVPAQRRQQRHCTASRGAIAPELGGLITQNFLPREVAAAAHGEPTAPTQCHGNAAAAGADASNCGVRTVPDGRGGRLLAAGSGGAALAGRGTTTDVAPLPLGGARITGGNDAEGGGAGAVACRDDAFDGVPGGGPATAQGASNESRGMVRIAERPADGSGTAAGATAASPTGASAVVEAPLIGGDGKRKKGKEWRGWRTRDWHRARRGRR